jgi:hypothetical protein
VLAAQLGVTRQSLNKALTGLATRGRIDVAGRDVVLRDIARTSLLHRQLTGQAAGRSAAPVRPPADAGPGQARGRHRNSAPGVTKVLDVHPQQPAVGGGDDRRRARRGVDQAKLADVARRRDRRQHPLDAVEPTPHRELALLEHPQRRRRPERDRLTSGLSSPDTAAQDNVIAHIEALGLE